MTTHAESVLADCPLFTGLESAERDEILAAMERETHAAGELILREGRSIQILWIITRGRCEVLKSMTSGGHQQLAVLEPGAVFGEMSFFHPAPHSASIRTLTEVEVLRLSREKYDQLACDGSIVGYRMASNAGRVLAERLRRMDEWVCEMVARPGGETHRDEWREFQKKLYTEWQF
ncbi:MAG: cyclic nucleotide-binding domain-containing protein [Planctomycetes bacterium]|nr:cyclic nucleotide-binding domain-containing protein [Planctomycetota bacterium]